MPPVMVEVEEVAILVEVVDKPEEEVVEVVIQVQVLQMLYKLWGTNQETGRY